MPSADAADAAAQRDHRRRRPRARDSAAIAHEFGSLRSPSPVARRRAPRLARRRARGRLRGVRRTSRRRRISAPLGRPRQRSPASPTACSPTAATPMRSSRNDRAARRRSGGRRQRPSPPRPPPPPSPPKPAKPPPAPCAVASADVARARGARMVGGHAAGRAGRLANAERAAGDAVARRGAHRRRPPPLASLALNPPRGRRGWTAPKGCRLCGRAAGEPAAAVHHRRPPPPPPPPRSFRRDGTREAAAAAVPATYPSRGPGKARIDVALTPSMPRAARCSCRRGARRAVGGADEVALDEMSRHRATNLEAALPPGRDDDARALALRASSLSSHEKRRRLRGQSHYQRADVHVPIGRVGRHLDEGRPERQRDRPGRGDGRRPPLAAVAAAVRWRAVWDGRCGARCSPAAARTTAWPPSSRLDLTALPRLPRRPARRTLERARACRSCPQLCATAQAASASVSTALLRVMLDRLRGGGVQRRARCAPSSVARAPQPTRRR